MSTSNKRGQKRPAGPTAAGRPVKIGAGAARADPPSRLSARSAAGGLPEDAADPQPRQNGGGSGGGAAAARPRRMKKAREIEPIAACSTAPPPKQEHRFAAAVLYMEDKGTLAAICDTFRIEKQAAFYYVGLFRKGEAVYTPQQVGVAERMLTDAEALHATAAAAAAATEQQQGGTEKEEIYAERCRRAKKLAQRVRSSGLRRRRKGQKRRRRARSSAMSSGRAWRQLATITRHSRARGPSCWGWIPCARFWSTSIAEIMAP
jgi:hypothetical protein